MLDKKTSTKGKYDKSTLISKKSGMSFPVIIEPPESPEESEVINDEDLDKSIGHLIKSQVHLPHERGWFMDGRSGEAFFADLDTKNFRIVKSNTLSATDNGEAGSFAWDTDYIYVCVDDNTWKKVALGTIPPGVEFTTGKHFKTGDLISLESDGKAYPTRLIQGDSVAATDSTLDVGDDPMENTPVRLFDCTDSVKVAVQYSYKQFSADSVKVDRIVIDPTDATISSISTATITSTGVVTEMYQFDAQMLDSSHIAICWIDQVAGTYQLATKVIDISSGITEGTAVQIDTGNGLTTSKLAISVEDSGEYFIWYQDASNGIKAVQCTVSGTTVTEGTSNTITDDTSDQVYGACKFEDTSHHLVAYEDDSAGACVFQCGSNASGTLTMGTTVGAGTYSSGAATTSVHTIVSLDSTTCVSFNAYDNVTWNVHERCITRSGTTLTVRASTGYIEGLENGEQMPPGVVNLGNREVAVVYHSAGDSSSIILYYETTAYPEHVGSVYEEATAVSGNEGICKATGNALMVLAFDDTNGKQYVYTLNHTNNFDGYIGVALEDSTAPDQTKHVQVYGKNSGMSGLTAGSRHYTNPSGVASVGRTHNAERAGVAESATEMIIQP